MELSPTVIVVAVVGLIAVVVLSRWGKRHEAAAPVDTPSPAARASMTAARDDRETQALAGWLLERANEQTGLRVADDALARDRITQAASLALEHLRSGTSTTISLPFLTADAQGPRHFSVTFKRNPDSTFELQG